MNILDKASRLLDGVKILSEWLGNGGIVVSPEDAQRRADVCLDCSKNEENHGLPFSVAMHIKRQKELKSSLDLRVKGEKQLGICSVCQCCIPLKIWVPFQDLMKGDGRSRLPEFPEHCWMVKESKSWNQS